MQPIVEINLIKKHFLFIGVFIQIKYLSIKFLKKYIIGDDSDRKECLNYFKISCSQFSEKEGDAIPAYPHPG